MSGMLEIEGVYTAYDKADVLQGVSLTVEAGRITCLLGSNGSGKTTLVRSILGLTPPRVGRIVFDGVRHHAVRRRTRSSPPASPAFPEGRKVFPKLTVEENLRVGAYQERSDKVSAASASMKSCTFSRGWPSGARSLPAPCRAASRRWYRSAAV